MLNNGSEGVSEDLDHTGPRQLHVDLGHGIHGGRLGGGRPGHRRPFKGSHPSADCPKRKNGKTDYLHGLACTIRSEITNEFSRDAEDDEGTARSKTTHRNRILANRVAGATIVIRALPWADTESLDEWADLFSSLMIYGGYHANIESWEDLGMNAPDQWEDLGMNAPDQTPPPPKKSASFLMNHSVGNDFMMRGSAIEDAARWAIVSQTHPSTIEMQPHPTRIPESAVADPEPRGRQRRPKGKKGNRPQEYRPVRADIAFTTRGGMYKVIDTTFVDVQSDAKARTEKPSSHLKARERKKIDQYRPLYQRGSFEPWVFTGSGAASESTRKALMELCCKTLDSTTTSDHDRYALLLG